MINGDLSIRAIRAALGVIEIKVYDITTFEPKIQIFGCDIREVLANFSIICTNTAIISINRIMDTHALDPVAVTDS